MIRTQFRQSAYIGTLEPCESAEINFTTGGVTIPAPTRTCEGCVVPLAIPDWSGDADCKACGGHVVNNQYIPAGQRDNYGNFPHYARMERGCHECGHTWTEATKAGTERRQLILENMPPILFKKGDKVICKQQKYAADGNTKTHIEEIPGCVVQDKPFLCSGFLSTGDECVWRYFVQVPGWNHDLTLAQEDLRKENFGECHES